MRTGADAGSAELGGKYMKKSISVVTLFPGASQCYAGQIRELFGDLVEVYSYSTSDQSVEKITRTDLYLVSTDAFKIAEEESQYVPADGQVVEIYVGYSKEVIRRLKEIPAGTRVLFVNVTHQMAREAITQLEQSGVNQLQFIPYGPDVFTMEPTFGDDVVPENVKLAVTPDEMDFVPAGMEQVINIGHRPCTANTMIETALRLGLESVMEEKKFQNYIHSMASGNYSFEQMFQRSRNLESQLDLLLEILDEGVIGVNEKGKIFACNQKARVITGMKIRMLLGRPAEQIFPYIPFEKCIREQTQVLERLIRINAANINMTVVPVMRGGRCIGAFSTLQPLSELEKKQNELRSQLRTKGYRAKYNFEDVVGKSQAIEKTKTILKSMAQTESPILLIGETGTGKEMFAQSIHNASPRRNGPFVAINCTALNRNLLESELFGYADSSFTGARKGGKAGLFETAHGGTIFLDEIGELPLEFQAPLLRVLQEKEVRRVGDDTVIPVDIRVVAATNRNLLQLVEAGKFRMDLYYRLNVLSVVVPPLRNREEDYQEIAGRIYDRLMPERSKEEEQAFFNILRRCQDYPWPGNVRELNNLVERVSLLLHQGVPEKEAFQAFYNEWQKEEIPSPEEKQIETAGAIIDREAVLAALRRNGGNASRTAKELGISRSTLYRRLK
mgnify:CR=1 FL=1